MPLEVDENGNSDAVFVNGKFYHEKCFTKIIEPKERCFGCKKQVDFSTDDVAYYDGHFWHADCIIKKSQKTKTPKWKLAVQTLDDSRAFANKKLQDIKAEFDEALTHIGKYKSAANAEIGKWKAQSQLNDYIRDTYTVQNVPWQALGQIYRGTYRGLKSPIPAEHLLDMWRRKQKFLNKVYQNNKTHGKDFSPEQRINYDIAILINKYDSYLKWKRDQEAQIPEETAPSKIDMVNLLATQVIAAQPKDDNKKENIEGLADDIFG